MAKASSAFKVGGFIEAPYFVDRVDELQHLHHDARTLSQSNVVIAPRRFGKTSLLRAVESRASEEMLVSYINCLGIVDPVGFHDRFVEEVLRSFAARHGKGKRLLVTWRDLLKKPVLGMRDALSEIGGSVEGMGAIRLKFRTREVDAQALLESALAFPEKLVAEQDERVLIILDEFQALVPLGEHIFSLLKEKMESQKKVVYLFSGSSFRMLHEVFGREGKSPLYQMVGRLFLGEIPYPFVHRFYRERLQDVHACEITGPALSQVTEHVGGIPYYFQKLGVSLEREITLRNKKKINSHDVEKAFTLLLEELSGDFQERWETRFTGQQRAILKTLSREPMSVTEIAHSLDVSPANISYNLSRQTEAMILTKEDRRYRITDRVFAAWLEEL
ncbi:MAG TPA: ATP-binding protein [Bacteroidetes bacterium]|nr:ATP-binding protein [Bacteroidota bacterium]HEX04495.1 ATP-binding protein [Bacteroidota bacterium]